MLCKFRIFFLFILIFCSCCGVCWASVMDFSSFNSVTHTMVLFLKDVDAVINAVFAGGELAAFVRREWAFFSILLISWFAFDYICAKAGLRELFALVLTISITKVFINYYDSITTAFWGWSVGFAEGIQQAAIGNTDLFFLPSYIFNFCKSLSFGDMSLFDASITGLLALLIGTVVSLLLGLLAVLTVTWAIWGYSLAKMIGWMFIPMLMFERLEWLFSGWLRLFFGFLLYNVIARVNLVLVALILKNLLGATSISPTQDMPFQMAMTSIYDVAGVLVFLVVAVLALISTGKFASTIAGSGGGGGGLRQFINFATKGAGS